MTVSEQTAGEQIRVELCWGDANEQHRLPLLVPSDSTLGDALFAARLLDSERSVDASSARPPQDFVAAGIFGQRCGPATRLREGDRIELYRPLLADPKDARRARVAEQSSKSRRT